jgi:hypothetical protein
VVRLTVDLDHKYRAFSVRIAPNELDGVTGGRRRLIGECDVRRIEPAVAKYRTCDASDDWGIREGLFIDWREVRGTEVRNDNQRCNRKHALQGASEMPWLLPPASNDGIPVRSSDRSFNQSSGGFKLQISKSLFQIVGHMECTS